MPAVTATVVESSKLSPYEELLLVIPIFFGSVEQSAWRIQDAWAKPPSTIVPILWGLALLSTEKPAGGTSSARFEKAGIVPLLKTVTLNSKDWLGESWAASGLKEKLGSTAAWKFSSVARA